MKSSPNASSRIASRKAAHKASTPYQHPSEAPEKEQKKEQKKKKTPKAHTQPAIVGRAHLDFVWLGAEPKVDKKASSSTSIKSREKKTSTTVSSLSPTGQNSENDTKWMQV
jgi:hypothetical protein